MADNGSIIKTVAVMAATGMFALLAHALGKTDKPGITYNTELESVIVTSENARSVLAANALSVSGLEAGNPSTLTMFAELLGPPPIAPDGSEIPWASILKKPYGKGGMSTCAIVAENLQRRAGSPFQDLYRPYVPGMAISRFLVWASQFPGAVRKPDGVSLPRKGDYVVIGEVTTNELHVLTPIKDVGAKCVSVDGGQVGPDGLQAIYTVTRNATPYSIGGRTLYRWVDCTKLPYGKGLAPRGWKGY